jgi:hypothetical protein
MSYYKKRSLESTYRELARRSPTGQANPPQIDGKSSSSVAFGVT